MYKAEEILNAREKRVKFQSELQKKYKKTLLVARVNYPGVDKDNNLTRNILGIMDMVLTQIFKLKICYKLLTFTAEGPILIFIIDKKALEVKKVAIEIEDGHMLGRCVDIDVYDENGMQVSRKHVNMKPRKCFICDEYAHNCVRARKHNIDEVKNFISRKYEEYMENFYGNIKY